MNLKTFVFTDGHKTGLSAMLAQGETRETARPVAFASRSTNKLVVLSPLFHLVQA
jgi:hypothetical protein